MYKDLFIKFEVDLCRNERDIPSGRKVGLADVWLNDSTWIESGREGPMLIIVEA